MTPTQAPKDTALRDVRVKALVWDFSGSGGQHARSPIGRFSVERLTRTEWFAFVNSSHLDGVGYASIDEAKSVADTEYQRRILSALEPSPALVQSNRERDQAREALADLASWFDGGPSQYGPWIIRAGEHGADAAVEAARAVLSSLPPSPSKEGEQ